MGFGAVNRHRRWATKPCPCGNAGEPTRVCTCSEGEIVRYRGRLSGPLADRIDMHVTLSAVAPSAMQRASDGEPSTTIRARVEQSRAIQRRRFARLPGVRCNAHASGRWLLSHGAIAPAARELVTSAMETLNLSARGYHRVLRVARTACREPFSDDVPFAIAAYTTATYITRRAARIVPLRPTNTYAIPLSPPRTLDDFFLMRWSCHA